MASSKDYLEELEVAISAAKEAGAVIREAFLADKEFKVKTSGCWAGPD
jgi:hypothetical protein